MSILEVSFTHHYASGFSFNIDFTIDNKITSIFGPSGSGKTTILAMIAGLKSPAEGRIVLNDRVLFDQSSNVNIPIHQRRIGVIFQDHLLFPHFNVEKNLLYGFHGRTPSSAHSDFQRVCAVLEIGHLLSRYPKTLSGGECQRVAIGRTLLSSPEALLMDEPLASLDDRLRDSILNYLDRIIEEWNIPKEDIVVIVDGANDIKLFDISNLGIAYRAQDLVKDLATITLEEKDLTKIIPIINKHYSMKLPIPISS